ncbi:MAG: IclR family transcriptional regulator, partial [Halodesulfurarchaeum sp.]
ATTTRVADRLGLAKSTVHRHLRTLHSLGYVVKEGDTYRLSLRFLQLSEQPRNRKEGFIIAKQKVIELAQETDLSALFLVEEGFEGVYMHRAGSQHPLRSDTMLGNRRPLHALATGKAILAEWPDERVEAFIERRGLPKLTANTITEPEALFEELEHIRERSYAVNRGEHMDGLKAVGVPVADPSDDLLGGLGVFGPQSKLPDDRLSEFSDRVTEKVEELRVTLAYD